MSTLDFGYWDSLGGYEMDKAACAADVYDRRIRMAQELEGLGYHSYWVIETKLAGGSVHISKRVSDCHCQPYEQASPWGDGLADPVSQPPTTRGRGCYAGQPFSRPGGVRKRYWRA